jgi:hypothetical protein
MAKGEFAQFVKAHYEKVKHLPARERLKALGEMYRGRGGGDKGAGLFGNLMHFGKMLTGGEVGKKRGRKAKAEEGAGLLSDAFEHLGPLNPLNFIGGELEGGKVKRGKTRKVKGGVVEEMPMNLVPPSVPVDRRSTAGVNVPGAIYSGVKVFNPHEQAIEMKRRVEPKMKQEQGTFRKQGASQPDRHSTDLKTIMQSFGMGMPKGMRNKQPGDKLTKAHLSKIYQHAVATHGEEKGGNIFDDMWGGFKQGFTLPFQAVGSVANAIL